MSYPQLLNLHFFAIMKFIILLIFFDFTFGVMGQKKFALVIGNANYNDHSLNLKNPVLDANVISDSLKACNFAVSKLLNASLKQFKLELVKFAQKIDSEKCVALFYYSGHGVQSQGTNYLIPTDAQIASEAALMDAAISLEDIFSVFKNSKAIVNIFVLDACRSNPFVRGLQIGLAPAKNPEESIILFSAAPGQAAYESTIDSVRDYSIILSKYLTDSTLTIEQIHKSASRIIRKTFPTQIPWISSNLDFDLYLSGIKSGILNTENLRQFTSNRAMNYSYENNTPPTGKPDSSNAGKIRKRDIYEVKNTALFIGTDEYTSSDWPKLHNPIFDVASVASDLKTHFDFDTIVMRNPNRNEIQIALRQLTKESEKDSMVNSNILIYISGHGGFDPNSEGYIVPTDAKTLTNDEFLDTYITYSSLKKSLEHFKCRHLLLVLDVCNGGNFSDPKNLYRSKKKEYPELAPREVYIRKARFKSKLFITSGGKENVFDGIENKHSPFAYKFISEIRNAYVANKALTFARLFVEMEALNPQPTHGDFGDSEPEGDFIFLPKK